MAGVRNFMRQRQPGGCAFIAGDPAEPGDPFCGRRKDQRRGGPYCPEHRDLCIKAAKARDHGEGEGEPAGGADVGGDRMLPRDADLPDAA